MNFLHATLIAGAVVAIVPLLIHLSGRKQPKPVLFPAMRFVQQTKLVAAKGWSVKRWLLLFLRMLMVALAALAFASPRVHGASFASWIMIGIVGVLSLIALTACVFAYVNRATSAIRYTTMFLAAALGTVAVLWGGWVVARGPAVPAQMSSGPVAAAIIVDTSPTMGYRFENQTRLEKAKGFAQWIIDRFDDQSQIGIITESVTDRLQMGHANAEAQLEALKIEDRVVDLQSRIERAIELVRASNIDRREIYILSDLSINQWNQSDQGISTLWNEEEPILVQFVDVGVSEPRNWGIDQVRVTQDVASVGGTVQVDLAIRSTQHTPAEQLIVELRTEQQDATLPVLRDGKLIVPSSSVLERKVVDAVGGGQTIELSFIVDNIQLGVNHYEFELMTSDPLERDNHWAFTIDGVAGGDILVIDAAGESAKDSDTKDRGAEYLELILNPELVDAVDSKRNANSAGAVLSLDDFDRRDLSGVSVIALYNPPLNLKPLSVTRLKDFVTAGGGLILCLGDNLGAVDGVSTEQAEGLETLLPGKVTRLTRRKTSDLFFETVYATHGVMREFGSEASKVPWRRFPVFRHWDVDELKPSATTLIRYTINGLPALIEDSFGQGRILTFTTPLPDLTRSGHEPWNDLFTQTDYWPSFGLLLGASRYLQVSGKTFRNFQVGENAFLQWNDSAVPKSLELFHPDGTLEQVALDTNSLVYGFTNESGHYRMRGVVDTAQVVKGFSIHMAPGATELTRASEDDLERILGPEQFSVAANTESLRESIGQGRFGRDLAPFLFLVVAGIFLAEQAMSQHYYASRATVTGAKRR